MKWIEIPSQEFYDESKNEFFTIQGCRFKIEHSLVSVSKWEAKWKKPFLHTSLSRAMWLDYIRCMTITQNVDPNVYRIIPNTILNEIKDYVDESQTATTINKNNKKPSKSNGQFVTSELIYFWMTSYNIPFECEKWHLSRLLTLIEVCSIENAPKKKMSKNDLYNRHRALNKARRKAKR